MLKWKEMLLFFYAFIVKDVPMKQTDLMQSGSEQIN